MNELVWKKYEQQKDRGTEGFGFFNGHHIIKAAVEKRIKHQILKKKKNQTDLMLFHHRWPTSTVNEKKGAHPYNTGDYFGDTKYILVHNGKIRNSHDLKEQHEIAGITYQSVFRDGTFNDSESLLWDVALTMEGKKKQLDAYGDVAFICIKMEKGIPTKMYYGRNYGRPLVMQRVKRLGMMLSSEGAGEDVPVHTLFTYNYQLHRLTSRKFKIPTLDPTFVASTAYGTASGYGTYGRLGSGSSYSGRRYYGGGNTCGYGGDDFYGDDDENVYGVDSWVDAQGKLHYYETDDYTDTDNTEFDYDDFDEATGTWRQQTATITIPTHIRELVKPAKADDTEVTNRIWQELALAQGHFNTAYWALERQFDVLESKSDTKTLGQHRELNLLSRAIDELNSMKGFDDENSIHSMWQKLHNNREGVPR